MDYDFTEKSDIIKLITTNELHELNFIINKINSEAKSKATFLLDKMGNQVISIYDNEKIENDNTNDRLVEEKFNKMVAEYEIVGCLGGDKQDSIHISIAGEWLILAIVFRNTSSVGLVRLTVKNNYNGLVTIINSIVDRINKENRVIVDGHQLISKITDDDINRLVF